MSVVSTNLFVYGGYIYNYLQPVRIVEESIMTEETRDDQELALRAQHNSVPDFNSCQELKFNHEVIQISCGYSHGLLLISEGMVFSFGSNQFGQRGIQSAEAFTPALVIRQKASYVAAGLYHSAAIIDGLAFTWGRGSEGQLGTGDFESRDEPRRVPQLTHLQAIACGGAHSLFLAQGGQVYSCGDNTWGQLGQAASNSKPAQVDIKKKILQIQTGLEHSIFLTIKKEVFICGNNLFGQCGKEGVSNLRSPCQIIFQQEVNAIYASLGTFSAVKTINDELLLWGTGSWGHCRKPTLIQDICTLQNQNIQNTRFKNLVLGDNYAITVDSNSKMHLLGTQKLPDLNSSFSKLECAALKIQKGVSMGGGNRYVITAQYVEQDSFDMIFQDAQQREILSPVYKDCKRCKEMEVKCGQLATIIEEKDNLIEHIRKEQAQLLEEIEKQQLTITQQLKRITDLELEQNSRTFREIQQYKKPSSNKTEQQPRPASQDATASSRNPSYQRLGQIVGSCSKNGNINRCQSQIRRSITPVDNNDNNDRLNTQQETNDNQSIEQEDKRQNLNKSRGLIQSINSILTEFRSLNVKNVNDKITHHSNQNNIFYMPSKENVAPIQSCSLIKTYFQRIEQLQQNIAKSKNELKKSLEANKASFVDDGKCGSIDPVSMNFRKHSEICNNNNNIGIYKGNSSGAKSVERMREQYPKEILQFANKTDREQTNDEAKRKNIANRYQSRKTEILQKNNEKARIQI